MLGTFTAALFLAGLSRTGAQSISGPTVPPSHRVGRLPALGWNSWNAYHCDVNGTLILNAAHDLVTLGLSDAGYQYVNIDDCWASKSRDASGRLVPDPVKFPDGIRGVAEEVHELGLKMGLYSTAGTMTCAGYPASLEHETTDARSFASWGVDYLKYDNCNVPANWTDAPTPAGNDWYNSNSAVRFRRMTAALAATGRTFQIDICIWGEAEVWEWGARVGHSWRMTGDVSPDWNSVLGIIGFNAKHLDTIDFFGHNDMDMMEIGNGGLTMEEERSHFAMWVAFKSPILLGTTLSNLSPDQLAIIKNRELLEFHQDDLVGTPAKVFQPTNATNTTVTPEFYSGLSQRGAHVFILNTGDAAADKTFEFSRVPELHARPGARFLVHDMWTGKDLGRFAGSFTTNLGAHDTAALLIRRA